VNVPVNFAMGLSGFHQVPVSGRRRIRGKAPWGRNKKDLSDRPR